MRGAALAMGDVRAIRGGPVPDPDVVALCEALLADARTGAVQCVVAVVERADGSVDHECEGLSDGFAMAGHLMMLARDVLEGEDEQE